MTTEIPTPPPQKDTFTAQDGMRLYTLIDQMTRRIESSLETVAARLAVIQKNNIDMIQLMEVIEGGLSENRIGRLEVELREAELEKEEAERRLRIVEEKVTIKQNLKDQNVDTGERFKAVYADMEKKKHDARAARWDELKWSATKAAVGFLAVAATGGFVGFIWWLIQLYVNRGP